MLGDQQVEMTMTAAEVDGRANVQTCMTPVRAGMQVRLQDGARTLGG